MPCPMGSVGFRIASRRVEGMERTLVFIVGPPAVGKMTVGMEVSALTGIPLFHNPCGRSITRPTSVSSRG